MRVCMRLQTVLAMITSGTARAVESRGEDPECNAHRSMAKRQTVAVVHEELERQDHEGAVEGVARVAAGLIGTNAGTLLCSRPVDAFTSL